MKSKDKKMQKHPEWKTTKQERGWYIFSQTARYGAQDLVPAYMNLFLLFNGVELATVAIITLIVKCIDAVDDIIFGFLVDKIDLKKIRCLDRIRGEGRYLPWVRCFLFLFPIAIAFFFLMPNSISQTGKLVWFTVTYLLYDLTYTLVDVPVQSTLMTMTDIPEERNHLVTAAYIVMIGALVGIKAFQSLLISEKVGMSVQAMALIFLVIYTIGMIPLTTKVKEHNAELKNVEEDKQEKYTVKEMLHALWNNKPYLILQLSSVIPSFLATGTGVSVFVSYYLYGSSTAMVIPSLIATVLILLGEMLAPAIASRFEYKKIRIICATASVFCSFAIFLVGYKNFNVIVALTLLSSIFAGVATMVSAYMGPMCIEYGKYKNGRETTGIFNAINTFFSKTSSSVASSLGLFILSFFGWVTVNAESFADLAAQNVQQPDSALQGLWLLNSLIPAIGSLLGLIILCFYNLKDKDAKLMGMCNAGEITRAECESRLSRKYR